MVVAVFVVVIVNIVMMVRVTVANTLQENGVRIVVPHNGFARENLQWRQTGEADKHRNTYSK